MRLALTLLFATLAAGCGAGGGDAAPAPSTPAPTAPTPPAPSLPAPAPSGPLSLGTWVDVTPSNADLTRQLNCDNYGVSSVQADPLRPSDLYAHFDCQGIWKSTDFGATWQGPIDTGRNGPVARDCAGGISIAAGTPGQPLIYRACIRGNSLWVGGFGFWRSTNGGTDWTGYHVAPGGNRQDFYAPAVDPADDRHLLMAGHEMNVLAESTDGGQTWRNVPHAAGMNEQGGTACVAFIDTPDAATRGKTFLWLAQHTGGTYGTWRTEDGGANWTPVDRNEHPHGGCQIYQPNGGNVVYMVGAYSRLGWGVLRSTDWGRTWVRVSDQQGSSVYGTSKYVYASSGGSALGLGSTASSDFQVAAQPGTGAWQKVNTPAGMRVGPSAVAVVNDGRNNILIGATGSGGLWRYVEP